MADGVARVLYTADGEEVKVYDIGGYRIIAAESQATRMLLVDIKTQLRILNMHMSQITEKDISERDLGEGEGVL